MTTEQQPAPDGWADAYRETMENVWQGTLGENDRIHSAADVAALVAFAAEIRAGIAAGLIAGTPIVRVPLVAVPMRDDQPRHCDHSYDQHHDLAGCAVDGCDCSWSKADLDAAGR